jgi:signal transduction histidine kinase
VPISPLHVRSLYLKVVIPIVALVLAGMGGVWFFATRAMGEGVRLVAEQRARYGLAYVRSSFEDASNRTETDRGKILQSALERLSPSPDMDAVRILSASGRVLHSSRRTEVGLMMPAHLPAGPDSASREDTFQVLAERPNVLDATGPIANPRCSPCDARDQDEPAFADVEISLSRQSAGMRTWGEMATATAIAQFTMIGVGIILVLGIVVVGPIRRLGASMSQVQGGNLEVTAVPPGTIEIDDLVTGFNDMVGRLQRARQVEQDAQRSHMARVEQLATLGEVAASLAHEIRNPLAGSKAAIDVLAGDEKAEEPRRILRAVSEELARVDGVVRQLLKFARPKAPALAKVDLRALLDDAVLLSGPRAAAQGVTLELQRQSEPLDVMADADMVRQVIVNLLINALNAVEGVAGATVVLSTSTREGQAACSLKDNGPGVPEGRADAIFRPFMTTKLHGTGLGLATSRRLIELHGGRLWLENPGAPGACFTFTLPVFAGPDPTRA